MSVIEQIHVTCPNCKQANFNRVPNCTRRGPAIGSLWPKPEQPEPPKPEPPKK